MVTLEDLLGQPPSIEPSPEQQPDIPAVLHEREIAALIGITPQRVGQLARDGILSRVAPARYDTRATMLAYLGNLRQHAARAGRPVEDDELKKEKVRLARAGAEKVELANAKSRGELIPAVEVERAWSGVLRDVRAAVLASPSRIGSRLPHLSAHDVSEIARELSETLTALAASEGVSDAAD